MANSTAAQSDDIEIEFEAIDEKPLKYEAHVLKLIDADSKRTQEQIEEGLHATVKLTFPKEENGKPAVERYKRWFRESAAAHNVSAKVISETDDGAQNIVVKYAVVEKIVRPRKNKNADAPADVPTAA